MDKPLAFALVIFSVLGFTGTKVSAQCTSYRVQTCLKSFVDRIGSGMGQSGVGGNMDTLKTICSYYNDDYLPCVAPWKDSCYGMLKKALGVVDMYTYMCSDRGMTLYERHHSCLNSRATELETRTCNATLQRQLKEVVIDAQNGRISKTTVMDRLCRYAKQYMSCVRKPVTKRCGTEASEYLENVVKIPLQAALDDCNLDGPEISESDGEETKNPKLENEKENKERTNPLLDHPGNSAIFGDSKKPEVDYSSNQSSVPGRSVAIVFMGAFGGLVLIVIAVVARRMCTQALCRREVAYRTMTA